MRKRNSEFWYWFWQIVFYIVLIAVCVFVSKHFFIWVVTSEWPDWVKWLLLN